MKKWYALHTRPYAEKRVAQQLARWNIESYVPGTGSFHSHRQSAFKPLFPGYLFIRLNLESELPAGWLSFPGIRYLVAYDSEPVPILDDVVALLRRKAAEFAAERVQGTTPRFKRGSLVRIKDGPFKDMLATFEGPDGPSQRVQVLLQALERSIRLQLSPSKLAVADGAKQPRMMKRPRRTRGRGRRIRS